MPRAGVLYRCFNHAYLEISVIGLLLYLSVPTANPGPCRPLVRSRLCPSAHQTNQCGQRSRGRAQSEWPPNSHSVGCAVVRWQELAGSAVVSDLGVTSASFDTRRFSTEPPSLESSLDNTVRLGRGGTRCAKPVSLGMFANKFERAVWRFGKSVAVGD